MGPWGQSIQSFRSPLLNPGLSWDRGLQGVAASSWRPSSPVSWETAGLTWGLLQRPRGVATSGVVCQDAGLASDSCRSTW